MIFGSTASPLTKINTENMHNFPKGSYMKKGKDFRRVIEELGEIRFPSCTWDLIDKIEVRKKYVNWCGETSTVEELNAKGWLPCTAEEAGMPAEKWKPNNGDRYWLIDSIGKIDSLLWDGSEFDIWKVKTDNCFRTKEEAEAKLAEIMARGE